MPPGTGLLFTGYDPERKAFFNFVSTFSPTNDSAPLIEGTLVMMLGESNFLMSWITDPTNYPTVQSEIALQTYRDMFKSHIPIEEERMVKCILEFFELHRKHARALNLDVGQIGEPYRIYKITKGGVIKLR